MQAADPLVRRRPEPTKEEGATGAASTSSVPTTREEPQESLQNEERTRQASTNSVSAIEKERRMQEDKETRDLSSIAYEKMEDTEKKA